MTSSDFHNLLSSIKGLSPAQVRKLRQQIDRQLTQPEPPPAPSPTKARKRAGTPSRRKKPLSEAELRQHMLDIGLMTQFPDTAADFDDPDDQPIAIKGEPLSETILRERR